MKKKSTWVLILFLALAVWYLLPPAGTSQPTISKSDTVDQDNAIDERHTSLALLKASADSSKPPMPHSFLQCREFNKQHAKQLRKWQENLQQEAINFSNQGFSLDEIAYAIEHFRNGNFAIDWRLEQQKVDARVTKENQELATQLEDMLGEKLPINFHLEQTFPRKNLVGYKQMSSQERHQAVLTDAPTVDDIAAFIKAKELDESEILQLLEFVADPAEIIGSTDTRHPLYLFELAVAYGLYDVVNYLSDNNVLPRQDSYMPNALEIAILNLNSELENSPDLIQQQLVQLIIRLSQQGLTARLQLSDNGQIEGSSSLIHYQFDAKTSLTLTREYDIDLLSMRRETSPEAKESLSQLIEMIANQKSNYLQQAYGEFAFEQAIDHCTALNQTISEVWQPPSIMFSAELKELTQRNNGVRQLIEAELALKDPDFVDCYQYWENNRRIGREQDTELGRAFYNDHRMYEREKLVELMQQFELTTADRTWLYYQFLRHKPDSISIPLELGITADHLDYIRLNWRTTQIENLKFLDANGFDTKSIDKFGKTALYFAVKYQRGDLVKYMSENAYPFGSDSPSQDPLHILLASWKQGFSESAMLEMLPNIMQMTPDIDTYHLTRMKLINLRDRDLYETIVSQFPQLAVTDDSPYPQSGCF